MGVPIGDVARVSQVLLAQLQQSRDSPSGRTVSGVLSQNNFSTTQIQSSGNVETIDGFFKGDGGLLSNVVVGLQRVTDVGNTTTQSITSYQNVNAFNTIQTDAIKVLKYKSILEEDIIGEYTELQGKTINYFSATNDDNTILIVTSNISIVIKNGMYHVFEGAGTGELSINGDVILINNKVYRYWNNSWVNEFTIGNDTTRWAMSPNGNHIIASNPYLVYIGPGPSYYYNAGILYQYTYNGSSWNQTRSFRASDPIALRDIGAHSLCISNNGEFVGASIGTTGALYIYQYGSTYDSSTYISKYRATKSYISDDASLFILDDNLYSYNGKSRSTPTHASYDLLLSDIVNNVTVDGLFITRNTQNLSYYEKINGEWTVADVTDTYKNINTTFIKTSVVSSPLHYLGITSGGKIIRIKYQDDVQYKLDVPGNAIIENLTTDHISSDYISSDYFDGDGGGLSNLQPIMTLQDVTNFGNITNKVLVNINRTRSQVNYSPSVINGLILPQYVARTTETDYSLDGYTAIASDSAGTTIVLTYGTYFRTLYIDPNDKRIILRSFDVSDPEQFGNYAKVSNDGLRLLLKTSYGRVKFYTRWSITVEWEFQNSVYDNYGDHPYINNSIGFGASIDADDNLTVVAVGCPNFNRVTYYGPNTAVLDATSVGIVKTYTLGGYLYYIRTIQGPGIGGGQFGRNVGVSRDGSKVIINNYIHNMTGGLIRTVGRESGNMKISNDGTVVIIDDKLHKYSGSSWTYDILSGVIDITTSNATFKPSGNDIIKYEYDSGSTWTSTIAYSHATIDNVIRISDNGSTIITSIDGNLAIADILDGEPLDISGTTRTLALSNVTTGLTVSSNALVTGNVTTDKLFATSNIGIGTTTPAYALDVVGEIYASGTITQSSDIRKKSNLHVISEAMDKLNQIHGYMYDMDGKHRTGLVAQEVLEVLPEAVTGSEQSGYGLAYGDTIGLLVEAIKELNRLRDKDNERIKNLEDKMLT